MNLSTWGGRIYGCSSDPSALSTDNALSSVKIELASRLSRLICDGESRAQTSAVANVCRVGCVVRCEVEGKVGCVDWGTGWDAYWGEGLAVERTAARWDCRYSQFDRKTLRLPSVASL